MGLNINSDTLFSVLPVFGIVTNLVAPYSELFCLAYRSWSLYFSLYAAIRRYTPL